MIAHPVMPESCKCYCPMKLGAILTNMKLSSDCKLHQSAVVTRQGCQSVRYDLKFLQTNVDKIQFSGYPRKERERQVKSWTFFSG